MTAVIAAPAAPAEIGARVADGASDPRASAAHGDRFRREMERAGEDRGATSERDATSEHTSDRPDGGEDQADALAATAAAALAVTVRADYTPVEATAAANATVADATVEVDGTPGPAPTPTTPEMPTTTPDEAAPAVDDAADLTAPAAAETAAAEPVGIDADGAESPEPTRSTAPNSAAISDTDSRRVDGPTAHAPEAPSDTEAVTVASDAPAPTGAAPSSVPHPATAATASAPGAGPEVQVQLATDDPVLSTAEHMVRADELADDLRASFRRGADRRELTLQLHPAELGAVRVEARVVDGVTHLVLRAESAHASQRLAAELEQLRGDLAANGVDVGDLELRQGGAGDRDGNGDVPGPRVGPTGSAASHDTAASRPSPGPARPAHRGALALDL